MQSINRVDVLANLDADVAYELAACQAVDAAVAPADVWVSQTELEDARESVLGTLLRKTGEGRSRFVGDQGDIDRRALARYVSATLRWRVYDVVATRPLSFDEASDGRRPLHETVTDSDGHGDLWEELESALAVDECSRDAEIRAFVRREIDGAGLNHVRRTVLLCRMIRPAEHVPQPLSYEAIEAALEERGVLATTAKLRQDFRRARAELVRALGADMVDEVFPGGKTRGITVEQAGGWFPEAE